MCDDEKLCLFILIGVVLLIDEGSIIILFNEVDRMYYENLFLFIIVIVISVSMFLVEGNVMKLVCDEDKFGGELDDEEYLSYSMVVLDVFLF